MPQFIWTTGTITGNREVYANENAPVWSVSLKSGSVTPSGSSWAISSAYIRVCVRNAYGSQYQFYVRKGTVTGTVIGTLRPDDGSTSGVWNALPFSAAEIAQKDNFIGLTQMCFQGVYGTAMQILGSTEITLVVNWNATTSKCGAPTSVSVPANSNTDSVTVSWQGATNGTNNTISGYIFQARDSSDSGETYGSWSQVKTVSSTASSGSTTLPMPTTLGTYRQFRVQTTGSAGSSYYSDWSNTYGPCIRTAIAQAPNSVLVSNTTPTVSETITVSWTGAVAGNDDTIGGYAVLRSDAVDGEYESIGTVSTTATSGSMTTTSSDTFGETYYYRVQTLSGTSPAYDSAVSTVYASATSGYGKPTVPTDFTATPNKATAGGIVRLSWSASTDGYLNPVTGYQIVRSTTADGVYSDVGGTTNTYFMAPAPSSESTTYYYKVCAVGTINGYNSAYTSTPVTVNAVAPVVVAGGIGRTNAVVV